MDKIKIIILGNGQLGSFIFKNWKLKNYDVHVVDYPEFDLTNQQMIKDIVEKYDFIINAAAYTLVDQAENDKLNCFMINSMGPIMLASECIKQNKRLVHISTEAVYGSNDTEYVPIKEDAEKYPLNVYAKSKKIADEYIENLNNENILILRPGWLFGPDNNHNFIEKIKQLIIKNKTIKVVDDEKGSLTYVGLVLRAIDAFLKKRLPSGTYNIANHCFPSRFEVACFVKGQMLSMCNIEKCSSEEYNRKAKVAKNSCLNCDKIRTYIEIRRAWMEDVADVLKPWPKKFFDTLLNEEPLKSMTEGTNSDLVKKKTIKIGVFFYRDCAFPIEAEDEDVYLPIHCGRAVCTTGYSDFLGSMIGDDTGDNISILNPYLNEFTGIYWCGKHYEEIGNPDFFGSMHYRRFLRFNYPDLAEDTIYAIYTYFGISVFEQLTGAYCSKETYNEFVDLMFKDNKEERELFDKYFKEELGFYCCNLFIMPRAIFKRYFEFIESCINVCKSLMENSPWVKGELTRNWRCLAMLLERVTGFYIYKLKQEGMKIITP